MLDRILEEKSGDTDSILSHGISPDSGLGHFEYFVVFIILAISSLTLTWRPEPQAMAASDSFCASALNHLRLMVEVDEVQGLQVSLLLAHYAHMNPDKADNWICISNATRILFSISDCTSDLQRRWTRIKLSFDVSFFELLTVWKGPCVEFYDFLCHCSRN